MECQHTFSRASHLQAHSRIHLPSNSKTFACTRKGCDSTFWTNSHLKKHELIHDKTPVYSVSHLKLVFSMLTPKTQCCSCDCAQCDHCVSTFTRSNHLRDHIALTHSPPGTKPFRCSYTNCKSSFTMKQHLQNHEKTHDGMR